MDARSDAELLRDYATTASPAAMAELVRRHAGLVHATARRQVRNDVHLADDVAQATFLVLARRANSIRLPPTGSLAGWLYTTAQYAARNAMRAHRRRTIHESRAAALPWR
ncbi:MAG TPA: sigma-70 family RNA polymerase sigma factor [Tepidisphaeraceae bacterium]|nr:sigma-70 family RNA polymerase sigma factor [Tepidisphaeraceae bacterium]